MAVEFGKGITLAGGFDLGAKAPLDSRLTVATIADRDAHVTNNRAYEGMLVYVEADKTTYQYVDGTWNVFGFNETDFQTHVVDNLTTDSATQALSARQGKVLNDRLVIAEGLVADHKTAIQNIKNGDSLDSFKDVEDELKNYATDANAQKYASDAQAAAEAKAGEALAAANQAAQAAANAATAAGNAQTRADDAYALADAAVTSEELNAKDYATKTEAKGYADAKDAAIQAAKKAGDDAAAAAAEAKSAAQTAQETADSKTTMAAVEAKNYATKTEAQGYADAKDAAIEAAQGAADAAAEAAADNASAISTLKGGSEKTIAGLDSEIAQIAEKVNGLNDDYATDEELAQAKVDLVGAATTANTILWAKKAADDAASAASTNATAISDLKDGSSETIATLDQKIGAINTAMGKLNDTYATDAEVDAAKTALVGTATTANTILWAKKAADDAAAAASQNATAISDLTDHVKSQMQAADAMIYKGTVADADSLPEVADNVEIGWTYKASTTFPMGDKVIYAGDLLIANGDESEETGYLTSITWDHVDSGYVAEYVPEMSISNGAADDNIVSVELTSAHAASGVTGDLGAFTLQSAADSAVTISAKDSAISIGMAWGTF